MSGVYTTVFGFRLHFRIESETGRRNLISILASGYGTCGDAYGNAAGAFHLLHSRTFQIPVSAIPLQVIKECHKFGAHEDTIEAFI